MPAAATITAFYTFLRAKPARASQVNYNFAALRGHALPIDPNTATSADMTYDLGALDSRWRNLYTRKVHFTQTTTSSLTLEADTSGSFVFKQAGTEILRMTAGASYVGVNATLMDPTSTAAKGGIAVSSTINTTMSGAAGHLAGSTCTIQSTGRPILVGFMANNQTTTAAYICRHVFAIADTSTSYESGGLVVWADISILRNGVTVTTQRIKAGHREAAGFYPPSAIEHLDFATAGSVTYSVSVGSLTGFSYTGVTAGGYLTFSNVRLYAMGAP